MGTCLTKSVHNALVYYDSDLTHRWYDAVGAGVVKYLQDFVYWPVDDTTHDPTEWTNTIVEAGGGDSTADLTDEAGGALLITTAANENDGYKMQLGHGSGGAGENVKLDGDYPLYFGIRFKVNDADQTDVLFGFSLTDTSCLDAADTGVYFRSVDESATLYFVTEKDTVESATSVATLADDTYIVAEALFLNGTITAYVNGVEVTSTSNSASTFCDNEEMRLTLEFLTGEAVANTMSVDWARFIYIRN